MSHSQFTLSVSKYILVLIIIKRDVALLMASILWGQAAVTCTATIYPPSHPWCMCDLLPRQVVRDVLGLDTRDTSDTRDHAAGPGSALGKNYLGNDFLNINRMKIDVCTKEILHNTIII